MLKFVCAPDCAVAVSLSGTITGEDLDRFMSRLELTMNVFDIVDLYVETHEIAGVEPSALASYAARALPLFSKLRAFGRVAVVADQAWVRVFTRIESALLPFISYRVFEPGQREEALAWVRRRDEAEPATPGRAAHETDYAA